MFAGKDFTKDLARLEWKRPEDVVLRFKAPQAVRNSKKGLAKIRAERNQLESAKTRKSRVRYAP